MWPWRSMRPTRRSAASTSLPIFHLERGKGQAQIGGEGRDHHARHVGLTLVAGALERLAVNGDYAAFSEYLQEHCRERTKCGVERLGIDDAQHVGKRVVRRDSVLQPQEPFGKLDFRATELGHLRAVGGVTQHRKEGDNQDLDEVVAHVVGARIGGALEGAHEKRHGESPRCPGVPPRIHDSRLCKPNRTGHMRFPCPSPGHVLQDQSTPFRSDLTRSPF